MVYKGYGIIWDPTRGRAAGKCDIEGIFETSDLRIAKLAEAAGWQLIAGKAERAILEEEPKIEEALPVEKPKRGRKPRVKIEEPINDESEVVPEVEHNDE